MALKITTSGGSRQLLEITEVDEAVEKSCPFVDRIYNLAEKKGIPIKELEELGGVSKGYLSRLRKQQTPEESIGAKTLLAMADKLEVPVEYFLQEDYDPMTESEKKVLSFVEKLRKDTTDALMEWERDDIGWLNDLQGMGLDDYQFGNVEDHPLYILVEGHDVIAYGSDFYKNVNLRPIGSFYHTYLKKQKVHVYVTKVQKFKAEKHERPIYEVYLVGQKQEGKAEERIAIKLPKKYSTWDATWTYDGNTEQDAVADIASTEGDIVINPPTGSAAEFGWSLKASEQ